MTRADSAFYVGPPEEPDKYRLLSQVGSGGEAALWRAETSVSGAWEPVAIKILNDDKQRHVEIWRSRWAEQVELLRLIQRPGVVGIHQHFEGAPMHRAGTADPRDRGQLYLVMNWVDGTTLAEWRALEQQPGAGFEGLRYLMQVADILAWLHRGEATPSRRAVIHADLTPTNILINTSGQAVLVDFGLVRVAQHTSRVAEGTRGYWAPEVLREGLYTPAADRYSFGAVTFFVLTGEHPPDDPAAIKERLSRLPLVAATPGHLDHLMLMFDPRPEARPSPDEWIRAFRVHTTTSSSPLDLGLPPVRPPISAGELRSRPKAVGVGLAVVVLASIVGLWLLTNQPTNSQATPAASPTGMASTSPSPSPSFPSISPQPRDPTKMPRLIGYPAEETAAWLKERKIRVRLVNKWDEDETFEEGVITDQLPKEGSELPPVVRLTVARRPTVDYLGAIDPVKGDPPQYTTVVIGKREFSKSAVYGSCGTGTWMDNYNDWPNEAEYDLGAAYSEFRATIGLGRTAKNVSGKFQVLVDGSVARTEILAYGQSAEIVVPLDGAEQLTIRSTCNDAENTASQDWGDARLIVKP